MNIRKALITAANPRQRTLPLQTLVDRDGLNPNPPCRSSSRRPRAPASRNSGWWSVRAKRPRRRRGLWVTLRSSRVRFIPQTEPKGYGHALLCGRKLMGDEPFLHLVGDHLLRLSGRHQRA